MNSSGVNTPSIGSPLFNPQQILGSADEVKSGALKTLQETIKLLGTIPNEKSEASQIVKADGLPDLEAPTNTRNVNDITLRIGLLQDALNQLMAKVSKMEIKQRMTESQQENQKQLEKFKDQMAKAAEAAEKNRESQKKGNIFEAISNWIQAIVSVVSAIVTMISAVGQILTNPVGAAGLIVASLALMGTAAVQITLAIDATMRAAGEEGFLSESQKKDMQKAAEIMGYIAIAGSMIGLVGGVVVALGQAGKAAATITGKEVGKLAASKLVGEGMRDAAKATLKETSAKVAGALGKEVAREAGAATMREAAAAAAKEAFKATMKELTGMLGKLGLFVALGKATNDVTVGVGKNQIADLQQQASDLQAEADRAEAAAKAIEALINKLRALIEQLQAELEALLDDGQQTMSIIFGAIDEGADSMTRIHQMAGA